MATRVGDAFQRSQLAAELGGIPGNRQLADMQHKLALLYGSLTVGTGVGQVVMNVNDMALLTLFPWRCRVGRVRVSHGAMGASATVNLHLARRVRPGMVEGGQGSGSFIAEGPLLRWAVVAGPLPVSVAAAGEFDAANTNLANIGELVALDPALGPIYLAATATGGNWASAQHLKVLFEIAVV